MSLRLLFTSLWAGLTFSTVAQSVELLPLDGLCVVTTASSTLGRGVIADGKLIVAAHNLMAGIRIDKVVKIVCTSGGKWVPVELASPFEVSRAYKDFRKRFGPGSEAAVAFDLAAAPLKGPFQSPFTLENIDGSESQFRQFVVATLRHPGASSPRMEVHIAKKIKKRVAYNGGPTFYMSDGFPEVILGDSGSPLYVESGEKKILMGLVVARNETPKSITFSDVHVLKKQFGFCANAFTSSEYPRK